MPTGVEGMGSKNVCQRQTHHNRGGTTTPQELARQAELALLRACHREALHLANQCLSAFPSNPRHFNNRHNNNNKHHHHHHTLTCPIRWSPLATPRFLTLRTSRDDDTPWERCAAVVWQSWFALSSSSCSIHGLEPFWHCFTHSLSSTSNRSEPMSLELLLIILILCHQSSTSDGASLEWIVPLATEVLCLEGDDLVVLNNNPSRDELAIRLLCDWLPLSSVQQHVVPHMLSCVETRCWTPPPPPVPQWQATLLLSNNTNHTQALELCYHTSVRIPQPWAFTCRARLLEKLLIANDKVGDDDQGGGLLLCTQEQHQQMVVTTTYYGDYKNRILDLLRRVYIQWRNDSKEGSAFDFTSIRTHHKKSSLVLGLLCLLTAFYYYRRRRGPSVVRAALRRGGVLLLQPVREILQALVPS